MEVATRTVPPFGSEVRPAREVVTDVPGPERKRALEGKSFRLHHSLGCSPILSVAEVHKLAVRMLDEKRVDQVACVGGRATPGKAMTGVERLHAAVDALESLDSSKAWIRLTRVDEFNPTLNELSRQFIADLAALYGRDIGSNVLKSFVTLFISSPQQVTPYHMDHTWNFLLQIFGRKTVYLFDPDDSRVITAADKERWYMEREPGIELKPEPAGTGYDLEPGDGAHHPINAPHWVQNGAEVSVSLSLGLCLRDSIRYARVHQVNYILRRLGIEPTPPGRSWLRDGAKSAVLGAISKGSSTKFDDVVFSGKRRADRLLKLGGIRL